MPDIIKLLPDHVANQIAAGEVIQRPASVVKELLDNSVDAGSKNIQLIIEDAGKELIKVADDGKGMSDTDARLCWERHATSKINAVEDLFKLQTMGFRGEALASIASVSRVEMKTKRDADALGTNIIIEGSDVVKQENTAMPQGTVIAVKNLFYNIPARRNFLKSNTVEYKHIVEELTRCALANPEISFKLFNNNDEQLNLPAGELKERILQLYPDKKTTDLVYINEQTTLLTVDAYFGSPETAKKVRGEQYLFVNNRFVKDAYLNHAITAAFDGLISKEQFPFYVVKIFIEPALIDVNIHPSKTEIKFEDDKNVYQIIRAVAKKALAGFMKLVTTDDFDDNRFMQKQINSNALNFTQKFNQNDDTVGNTAKYNDGFKDIYSQSRQKQQNWDLLFKGLPNTETRIATQLHLNQPQEESKRCFQLHQSYIVTRIKSGLMLIDQQRAHERILFERYILALDKNPVASQQLLFPKAVNVNPLDELLLAEILPLIKLLGFNINLFGKNTYVINGLPAELHSGSEKNLIEELLDNYKQSQKAESNKNTIIAKALAKQAAIKPSTRLNTEEINTLIDELFACKEPKYSPDGKPCIKTLTFEEIAKML